MKTEQNNNLYWREDFTERNVINTVYGLEVVNNSNIKILNKLKSLIGNIKGSQIELSITPREGMPEQFTPIRKFGREMYVIQEFQNEFSRLVDLLEVEIGQEKTDSGLDKMADRKILDDYFKKDGLY